MTQAPPILYSFRRCPYAMRARMALLVAGPVVELREVALKDKPAAMLAASPKGTVPVLVLPDRVLEESLEIMLFALGARDPEGWLRTDLAAQRALIAACDGPFKHHLDRYKYATRYDGADPDAHREAGARFLSTLGERLAARDFLFADRRRLCDIAVFPFVRQFRIADPDWFDAEAPPPVAAWLARLAADPLFDAAMAKPKPWRDGDPPVLFGRAS